MLLADRWTEYQVLDTGFGEKLEKWGDVVLRRPDPQVIWSRTLSDDVWNDNHAMYLRSNQGGGHWEFNKKFNKNWVLNYQLINGKTIKFNVEPTSFKHTGIFPEQAVNWDWMAKLIEKRNSQGGAPVRVLNLFAYTGGASLACVSAGAEVCHVDASKGMVTKAKDNLQLSGMSDRPVRFIVDDCLKFVKREFRRGKVYDAIIMDPPSYGRGPGGEVWKIEDELYNLVMECRKILSNNPLFFLINSYTTGLQASVMSNILLRTVAEKYSDGVISSSEIGIPIKDQKMVLPCGASGRWNR